MTWIFGWMLKGIGRRGTKVFVVVLGVMLLDVSSSALVEKTNANYVTALLPSGRIAHAFLPRFHADSHWHEHQKNRPIPASSIYRTLSLSPNAV